MNSIERKVAATIGRVARLQKISAQVSSLQDYQSSADLKDIVERNLHLAIEGCLDIGKIIIALEQLPEPKDNKGVFLALAEGAIISPESLSFLIPMAGARNILVHGYDRIEDEQVYGVLKRRLPDFERFLREISRRYKLAEIESS